MSSLTQPSPLLDKLSTLNREESLRLSIAACRSTEAVRRYPEEKKGYRQQFSLDADRILHSKAYTRYIDKTQVFSLVTNDHITHRVLHVQLVARIARTIGRFLHLNEDLIEAIALGHDIGHPPFGHDGESFLSKLCIQHGLQPFQHNIQSVRFLDTLERKGRGWNLTLQVLDGILCHDGEVHSDKLSPVPIETFEDFDRKFQAKEKDPKQGLMPATMEGCVVRLADTVAYIGKDIEDAILLGIIERSDIPERCRSVLGESNGTIVYNLVTDIIANSETETSGTPYVGMSDTMSSVLKELKDFNYTFIYLAPKTKTKAPLIKQCYECLFHYYLDCLINNPDLLPAEIDLMGDLSTPSTIHYKPEERVRDFIAGMTDDFFLTQARLAGCSVPEKE